MKATIIDTPGGNKGSISAWLRRGGFQVDFSSSSEIINNSNIVIFPGNGIFSKTMDWLRFNALEESLISFVENPNKIYIGICIGMQILYETGFEEEKTSGLGILNGEITRLDNPRIGWEKVKYKEENFFFEDDFFFMHSYGYKNLENNLININRFSRNYLFQFHPEKSGRSGDDLLKSLKSREKL